MRAPSCCRSRAQHWAATDPSPCCTPAACPRRTVTQLRDRLAWFSGNGSADGSVTAAAAADGGDDDEQQGQQEQATEEPPRQQEEQKPRNEQPQEEQSKEEQPKEEQPKEAEKPKEEPPREQPKDAAAAAEPQRAVKSRASGDPFAGKFLDLSGLPTVFDMLTVHADENRWARPGPVPGAAHHHPEL